MRVEVSGEGKKGKSSSPSVASDGLTDLEAVTLGWVLKQKSTTAYAVRVHFEKSPSARFSGSAGAIYPLMRRLETRALLCSQPTATGKRRGRLYSITPAGRQQLKKWIKGPWDVGEMFTFDPFRTRMLYLGALTSRERMAWLDRAERSLEAQDAIIRRFVDSPDNADLFVQIANDHALRENRARRAWLVAAREALGQQVET